MKPKLTLYIGRTCHFCARVTDFLKTHPLEIEIKDVWENDAAKKEMLALTGGKTQVPCLRIDDTYMFESLDIIEKLKTL
ncbi:MAG: glutaredoxin [Proteobacteria bacterium]|nr:glutaredoxin [Pseudomonadota bacterium]